jgi:hypothetical protein
MNEDRKAEGSAANSFRGHDPRVIEIDNPTERAFWCKALFTTERRLVAAVAAVGHSAQRVKEYLQANPDP